MSAPSPPPPAAASPLPQPAQPSPPYSEAPPPAHGVAPPPASYFPVQAPPQPAPPSTDAADLSDVKLEGTEDPRNWSPPRKWSTAAIISFMGFISPLGSSIVVPGSAFIDNEFDLGSQILSLLPVSLFVLGLGMGPFILAPASELKGRQPVYLVSSIVFVLFNVATALAPNHAALVILRFLAGAAGSAGPSLGAGSIGDMFAPAERGRAQSLYGLGPLLGPVCGTIAGGWLSQTVRSWRWLLWVLTILSGLVVIIIALFLRETYGPVLLQQKQKRVAAERLKQLELLREHAAVPVSDGVHEQRDVLHRVVSAGRPSNPLVRHMRSLVPGQVAITKTKLAFSRPFRLLFTNPICAAFSLYMGFIYGIIFLFLTQHPLLFQQRDLEQEDEPRPDQLPTYGWRPGPASMTYLGLGLGFLTAALINVLLQDAIYHRLTASRGRLGWYLFDIPELIEQRMILRDAKAQPSAPADVEAAAGAPPCAERDMEKTPKLEPTISISQEKAAARAAAAGPSSSAAAPPTPAAPPRKGRPEYRLPLCLVGMIILPIGLFVFGWAADARVHWMAPLVGSYLVGMGSILPFQVILVYLVDAFVPFSASATACAVLVRSVLAAAFPLFAQKLFVSIGYGAGSSLLAGVAILAIPVPLVLFWKGEGLRQRYKFTG